MKNMKASDTEGPQAFDENQLALASAYAELFSYIPQPHRYYTAEDVSRRPFFFGELRELEDGKWVLEGLRYIADGIDAAPIPDIDTDGDSETGTMAIPLEPKPLGAENGDLVLAHVNAEFNAYGVAVFSAAGTNAKTLDRPLVIYRTKLVLEKLGGALRKNKLTSLDDVLEFFSEWKELELVFRRFEEKVDEINAAAEKTDRALAESLIAQESRKIKYDRECAKYEAHIGKLEDHIQSLLDETSRLKSEREKLAELNRKLVEHNERLRAQAELLQDIAKRKNRDSILGEIKRRGIEYFVHFTQVENIDSILEHGLCTRESLQSKGLAARVSDGNRRDDNRGAICLSVSLPNYKMFYRKRCQDEDVKWCVILLKPEYVIERDPFFYETNAASSEMTRGANTDRRSYEAFLKMFDRTGGGPSEGKYPTDPQAEVQVIQDLPIESISFIAFGDDESDKNYYFRIKKAGITPLSPKCNKGMFSYKKGESIWPESKDR